MCVCSGFGLKYLQKLGYEVGKGLGKQGTGISVPLKATKPRAQQGLGFEKKKEKRGKKRKGAAGEEGASESVDTFQFLNENVFNKKTKLNSGGGQKKGAKANEKSSASELRALVKQNIEDSNALQKALKEFRGGYERTRLACLWLHLYKRPHVHAQTNESNSGGILPGTSIAACWVEL